MLFCLLYFSFLTVYNQEVRTITIEPFFEELPKHISELNPEIHLLLNLESLDLAHVLA